MDCLFCKIISGEIPSNKVFENAKVYGFEDINPMAKEHYLFISKEHTKNVNETNHNLIINIFDGIKEFTQSNKLEEKGFRVVTNVNRDAGQTVFHTHFHVLGGEPLKAFGS